MGYNNLAVFDFDWSLIDEDSDHWVIRHLSPSQWDDYRSKKEQVKHLILLRDAALNQMQKDGITKEDITKVLKTAPMSEAMIETLKTLAQHHTRVLILSDANTYHINTILQTYGVDHLITDIITNPVYTDKEGRFRVGSWTPLDGPQHQCSLQCPANLCKGKELSAYIAKHGPFNKVTYVGDGKNDYCPILRLTETDRVLARSNRTLADLLTHGEETAIPVKARVTVWDRAETVLACVQKEVL
ncbi:phosphatase phospho-type [Spinellus fusiger]|nr:phosphatase phospho-type [Spinellus fusiger]